MWPISGVLAQNLNWPRKIRSEKQHRHAKIESLKIPGNGWPSACRFTQLSSQGLMWTIRLTNVQNVLEFGLIRMFAE